MINLEKLAKFIIVAKKATYANKNAVELSNPKRPGYKELKFSDGEFYYLDSYTGFDQGCGCGLEEVREENANGPILWTLSYFGGLSINLIEQDKEDVFNHLKESLSLVSEDMPFRGPRLNTGGKYHRLVYGSNVEGDIERFKGWEQIKISEYGSEIKLYDLDFMGGLVK